MCAVVSLADYTCIRAYPAATDPDLIPPTAAHAPDAWRAAGADDTTGRGNRGRAQLSVLAVEIFKSHLRMHRAMSIDATAHFLDFFCSRYVVTPRGGGHGSYIDYRIENDGMPPPPDRMLTVSV